MVDAIQNLKIGYVVKMFPRLSETFILNEILELERRGVEIVIFSLKKPNEGQFHPQLSKLKAKAFYLEGMDLKKWGDWLGNIWQFLLSHKQRLWPLLDEALNEKDNRKVENLLQAAWVGAKAEELNLSRLHAHFASMPSVTAYFAHLITGIPFSFTAHAKDIFVYNMEEHLLREKLTAADFVVTVTKYNHRYLTERAPEIDPGKIHVIHNGVDLKRFKPDDSKSRKRDLILSVGRLVPKKGFNTFLDACRLLKDQGTSFRCLIAGDGVEAENLHRKKIELGLIEEISFIGPKRQDEVINLMHEASLLCLPCTVAEDGNLDALPTVILEALACGLPVISTNVSGIPEIIDSEKDGILVDPDDPVALSRQIKRLLSSKELQVKFAQAGRRKAAEKFDLKKNVDSLLRLFSGSGNHMEVSRYTEKSSGNRDRHEKK